MPVHDLRKAKSHQESHGPCLFTETKFLRGICDDLLDYENKMKGTTGKNVVRNKEQCESTKVSVGGLDEREVLGCNC